MRHHLVTLIVALGLASSPASAGDTAQGFALQAFLIHLNALSTVRACAPAIPGYRERFDAAHARWKQRHATAIAQGERLVIEGARQERPEKAAKLAQIIEWRDRLAQPALPASAPPSAPTTAQLKWCEAIFQDLAPG